MPQSPGQDTISAQGAPVSLRGALSAATVLHMMSVDTFGNIVHTIEGVLMLALGIYALRRMPSSAVSG
ncbi:hypothetical protein FMUAM8_29230 [Nocardia cyriacigeorgica]|nr:hypothetical protein FMUAM8_29230 [Nocardia cyriacigeorgica]BDU06656.1 hypothetical protein FMUBM48_29190 [Nocardia cyriacigeorgica]